LIVKELKQTLKDTNSAEVRGSVKALPDDTGPLISDPTTLQGVRAVEALSHMGTPDARALLREIAKGAPAAPQTQAAQEALDQIDRLARLADKAR
jgi:hypothetical protein